MPSNWSRDRSAVNEAAVVLWSIMAVLSAFSALLMPIFMFVRHKNRWAGGRAGKDCLCGTAQEPVAGRQAGGRAGGEALFAWHKNQRVAEWGST